MQISNVKISNLLSYPYRPHLARLEGIKFYNREHSNVNILIGPNGAGKSWFLKILEQLIMVGLLQDYVCDTSLLMNKDVKERKKSITHYKHSFSWIHPHFVSPKKKSQVILEFFLTHHDYHNLWYITKHASIFNDLIVQYSDLDISYPALSHEEVYAIPSLLSLECTFNFDKGILDISTKKLSSHQKFVLLYFQTMELVQICIDIYNTHHTSPSTSLLVPLKQSIAFIGNNRSLLGVSNTIDPRAWMKFVADKDSFDYHSYLGFYLCAKKIWNIISDHSTLIMTKKHIANYPEKLKKSDFFVSLSFVIKKYLNKTLHIQYLDGVLVFHLLDVFGNYYNFDQLSDGQQSLLSMIFTLYGYDLKDGMVIIDEPEIHFHPQMQRSFARMIEKMNYNIGTQFVVSTYSPLFINESNISNVYRFNKSQWNTHIKNPVFSLSADESSLVHLLKFENLSKIFFVNKIIMVEGETDAYFFEHYLRYLHTLPERKQKITDYEVININGKWSHKLWKNFLAKFGLDWYFLGDRDNIVDYGLLTQNDLSYYYKQARSYYAWLKKNKKTHRHYNKLVDTLRNLFPQKYRYIIANIDELYKKNVFILKKWDIETYLWMWDKWLDKIVRFCHTRFDQWIEDKRFDSCRDEFNLIFSDIFK